MATKKRDTEKKPAMINVDPGAGLLAHTPVQRAGGAGTPDSSETGAFQVFQKPMLTPPRAVLIPKGRVVRGIVLVAGSGNPSSVGLHLNGALRTRGHFGGGFVLGAAPLTIDYEAETVISLWGDFYEIEVQEEVSQ